MQAPRMPLPTLRPLLGDGVILPQRLRTIVGFDLSPARSVSLCDVIYFIFSFERLYRFAVWRAVPAWTKLVSPVSAGNAWRVKRL